MRARIDAAAGTADEVGDARPVGGEAREPVAELPNPLAGLRVLDLTGLAGALCGRLLGDLGADVVRVEATENANERAASEVANATDWFYAAGKRSVALDPTDAGSRDRLRALVEHADLLVESSPPDLLGRFGMAREEIERALPRLVHIAITPFGRRGPRSTWRGSDLVCAAAAGMVFVNGYPDAAPLAPFGLQAYNSCGVFAAIAGLLGLRARRATDRGATIDLSVQAATAAAVEHVTGFHRQTGAIESRRGTLHWSRSFRIARCRDGDLLLCLLGDWTTLVEWVASDAPDVAALLREPRFEEVDARKADCERIFDALDRWAAPRSAFDLEETAQLLRLPFARVRAAHELAGDPQLAARDLSADRVDAADPRRPPPPFRLSASSWRERERSRPARRGEHSGAVLSDPAWVGAPDEHDAPPAHIASSAIGADADRLARASVASDDRRRPLAGITVLDFTWVVAGPVATRILADHGARVLKVERKNAADFGSRRGGLSGNLNRGKESLVLDLAQPRGLEIARRLAARSDVVVDNFSARVMRNLGLDYASLRAGHPEVIAVSMSGFGHSGPWRDHVSYGPTLQALAGFPGLMRHRDGPVCGWGYSWSDMAAGMMAAFATLVALEHRDRTGAGQWVDLGQYETLVALLGPAVFAALAGKQIAPFGNRSQEGAAVPHGVFRCAPGKRADGSTDDDRWVAIAVLDGADWRRLADVLRADGETWATERGVATVAERCARESEIERALAGWTRRRAAEEIAERLQSAGVAAAVVANGEDLCRRDPQLASRGFFRSARSPEGESFAFDGLPFADLGEPGRGIGSDVLAPGPLLGEHTEAVLRDLLGVSDGELAALRDQGVIG